MGEGSPIRTRSRAKKNGSATAEVTHYTTLRSKDKGKDIQVISKNKVKPTEKMKEHLQAKFDKLEAEVKDKLAAKDSPVSPRDRFRILLVTHFNVFLYATCFFIQVNTLPVRCLVHQSTISD